VFITLEHKNISPVIRGAARGDERTTPLSGRDNNNSLREPRDDSISFEEVMFVRDDTRWILGEYRASLRDDDL
jgi:hypothetical protein